MASEPDASPQSSVTADGAFGVLGNETRIQILYALGAADEPLSFSALREAVGVGDSGRFNYHLVKLDGTFVEKTADGYALLQAGRRVVEAIFSGVLTEDPGIERVPIDRPCQFCGAPIEARVSPGSIEAFCTECSGTFGESSASGRRVSAERGYLGKLSLPPAGFQDRTPEEVFHAAQVWGHLEVLSIANGICPRCSATLERWVEVCEDHAAADQDLCERCGNRFPVVVQTACTNCIFEAMGNLGLVLIGHPTVQAFKVAHGDNLVAPSPGKNPLSNREEVLVSADPFVARVTYSYEGEELTLVIDEELSIEEVTGGD